MNAQVEGDPKASSTVVVSIVGTILLLAIVVFAQVLFYSGQRFEDERKRYAPPPAELTQLQSEQLAQITTYRRPPTPDGPYAIPIDRAMELVVAELKSAPAPTIIPQREAQPAATPPAETP